MRFENDEKDCRRHHVTRDATTEQVPRRRMGVFVFSV